MPVCTSTLIHRYDIVLHIAFLVILRIALISFYIYFIATIALKCFY